MYLINKLSLIVFAIAVSVGKVSADPAVLHEGTAHDAIYSICLGEKSGIAVGIGGLVINSNDQGSTWVASNTLTDKALLDVSCIEDKVIVVGQEGALFVGDYGDLNSVKSGTDERLLGIDSNSNGLAIAVGGFGTILHSNDSGESWSSIDVNWETILGDIMEPHLYGVNVSEKGVITIVGEFELIMNSTDDGKSWNKVHSGDASLFSIDIHDDGVGYSVGQAGKILKSNNYGENWAELSNPITSILLDVNIRNPNSIYISGIGTLLQSSDAGLTFKEVNNTVVNDGWFQKIAIAKKSPDTDEDRVLLAGYSAKIIEIKHD